MIKINLLPKEYEQRAKVQQKIAMAVALAASVVLAIVGSYFGKVSKLNKINGDIAKTESELKKLGPVVNKVNEVKKKKDTLQKKVDVIKNLLKSRLVYPRFLEEFASLIPDGVWVTSVQTSGSDKRMNLNLNMFARDNYLIADLINGLEKSKKIGDIKFTGIDVASLEGEEIRKINIDCAYYPTGEIPKPAQTKKKKKKRSKRKRRR